MDPRYIFFLTAVCLFLPWVEINLRDKAPVGFSLLAWWKVAQTRIRPHCGWWETVSSSQSGTGYRDDARPSEQRTLRWQLPRAHEEENFDHVWKVFGNKPVAVLYGSHHRSGFFFFRPILRLRAAQNGDELHLTARTPPAMSVLVVAVALAVLIGAFAPAWLLGVVPVLVIGLAVYLKIILVAGRKDALQAFERLEELVQRPPEQADATIVET